MNYLLSGRKKEQQRPLFMPKKKIQNFLCPADFIKRQYSRFVESTKRFSIPSIDVLKGFHAGQNAYIMCKYSSKDRGTSKHPDEEDKIIDLCKTKQPLDKVLSLGEVEIVV